GELLGPLVPAHVPYQGAEPYTLAARQDDAPEARVALARVTRTIGPHGAPPRSSALSNHDASVPLTSRGGSARRPHSRKPPRRPIRGVGRTRSRRWGRGCRGDASRPRQNDASAAS